jgi:hypothetical protein
MPSWTPSAALRFGRPSVEVNDEDFCGDLGATFSSLFQPAGQELQVLWHIPLLSAAP